MLRTQALQSLSFGISVLPAGPTTGKALRLLQLADHLGYDLVDIQDHPYQWYFGQWCTPNSRQAR